MSLAPGRPETEDGAMRWILLLLLAGCGGAVTMDPPVKANPCGVPEFRGTDCREEILNYGKGPDAVRLACPAGRDLWLLYPSGEVFHLDTESNTTVCHSLPDGRVCGAVTCP